MIQLTKKTTTAERRIGNHRDKIDIIMTSFVIDSGVERHAIQPGWGECIVLFDRANYDSRQFLYLPGLRSSLSRKAEFHEPNNAGSHETY